jgi:DNA repair protein RecN (Recombination protein N)
MQQEKARPGEIELLHTQLNEIEESDVLHVDDNDLFSRLSDLEHAKEAFELASSMIAEIESGKTPLQATLFRLTKMAEKLSVLNSKSAAVVDLLNSACTATRETSHELKGLLSCFDFSEAERERLENQLRQIDGIKRRHGATVEEIRQAKESMEAKLRLLEGRDEELLALDEQCAQALEQCDSMARDLTKARTQAAQKFGTALEKQLRALNMPKATLTVDLSQAISTVSGEDRVQFSLTPNVGEKTIAIHDGASGGEIARLFLAIQAVMASRFVIPTVLFDEIDASIGGMTANAVGETLAAIGQERQVLAVTHFVQVAQKASSHFALTKEVNNGRTLTLVQELTSKSAKEKERQRMMGKL